MHEKQIFVTIGHIDEFCGYNHMRTGDLLLLKKDRNNVYDDEAIAAYDENGKKCGYVANSVHSVARGTYSAGRLYDVMKEEMKCRICFILDGNVIAEIMS